jgi:thioredoxin-like negative regulator of GroEL
MLQLCPPIHKGETIQVEAHPPRKLAVILHADVVDSTSLVQKNETLAHERIRDTFQRFSETISAYNGVAREIRGDALVAEFDRASDEARYQLSASKLVEDDHEGAMEQLLKIMCRDRGLRDDVGRNGLPAIFSILCNKGPLVERCRSLLMDHLH